MIRTTFTPVYPKQISQTPLRNATRPGKPAAPALTFSGKQYSALHLKPEEANEPDIVKSILDQQKGTLGGYYNPDNVKYIVSWITPKVTNVEVITMLAKALKGATGNINTLLPHGNSILHVAVSAGHPPIVKRLLELGASPEIGNINRQTPIHWLAKMSPDCTKADRNAIRDLLDNPPPIEEEPGWFSNPLPSMSSLYEKSASLVPSWSSLIPFGTDGKQTAADSATPVLLPDVPDAAPAEEVPDAAPVEEMPAAPAKEAPVVIAPKRKAMEIQVDDKEKKTSQAAFNKLNRQYQQLQRQLELEQQAHGVALQDIEKHTKTIQRLKKDLSGANQGTSRKHLELEAKTKALQEAQDALETERQGRLSDRQAAEAQQAALRKQLAEELKTAQAEARRLNKDLKASQKEIERIQKDLEATQTLYGQQKPLQDELRTKLRETESRFQKQLDAVNKDLKQAKQRLRDLEIELQAEQKKRQATQNDLTKQTTALEQEQTSHHSTRERLNEQTRNLESEKEVHQQTAALLKALQETSETDKYGHDEALSRQREAIEQAQREHQAINDAYQALQQQHAQAQEGYQLFLQDLGFRHAGQINDLGSQLDMSRAQTMELKEKLNASLKEKIDLEHANNELKSKALMDMLREPPQTDTKATQPPSDGSTDIDQHPAYQQAEYKNSVLEAAVQRLWKYLPEDPAHLSERENLLGLLEKAELSPIKDTEKDPDEIEFDDKPLKAEQPNKPALRRIRSASGI